MTERPSQKRNRGRSEDAESPPAPMLPPQSKVEEDRRPIHKVILPVGGGTTDGSSSQPQPRPGAGSEFSQFSLSETDPFIDTDPSAVAIERDPLKKEEDAKEPKKVIPTPSDMRPF